MAGDGGGSTSLMAATLAAEEVFDLLHKGVAADVADGLGERQLLGAGLDAVLGEAALLHATVTGERAETLFLEDGAGWVHVEELGLRDGGCADEACGVVELRADLHADGAGDAVRQRVTLLLNLRRLTRPGAEVVAAVDGHPGLDLLQVLEEYGAVHSEITDDREFGERLQRDGLV